MIFRPSRAPRGPDRFLPYKLLMFALGAGFGMAGIISERPWLINLGIAVLLAGVLLRLIGSRRG